MKWLMVLGLLMGVVSAVSSETLTRAEKLSSSEAELLNKARAEVAKAQANLKDVERK